MAREDTSPPGPPPRLDDDYFKWMVGEWEGTTRSPMGTSKERMKCRLDLEGQFLVTEFESDIESGGHYTGRGVMTVEPNGDLVGFWFDSRRTIARGSGKRDGKVVSMEWKDRSGKQTRVVEMVSEDRRKETIKMAGPDGKMIEAVSEMRRVAHGK